MIQLRLRTEYSFGDTFAPIPRVIERLKAIGCRAAGIVDGSTWGHVRWASACREAGIQPLLGVEVVVADGETPTKMWFLATTEDGLRRMYQVTSKSHRQTISTKRGALPRLYRADVARLGPEIVVFAGEVTDGEWLAEVGAVIDLNPASRVLNAKKAQIAQAHGLRVVSTSDNAYAFPEDRVVFELASRGGLKPSPQFILPQLEHQDEARRIAESCSGLVLPKAPMIHFAGDLERECREGIASRGMSTTWNDIYEQRLNYELKLIKDKDYESYFLVVSDMVRFAKQHMLVGPSRGSAAGSLVCYLARITEIDPIPPGLFFERFIDVTRTDLPDIDLDFPDDKRAMVFEYMAEKYGEGNVAKIGTISEFRPKSALIQVCKSLGIPPTATAAVKVAMIERSSADSRANNCLEDTFTTTDPGRQFIAAYPEAGKAALLEGHASHTGVHAAGLLVCNDEITNYATVDAAGIAHVEKGAAEQLGLLKIDVLGLRTLGILEDSGVPIDWYNLKFDDPAVYEVFNQGRMCGIFQFEGNALREISRQVRFKTLREIDAVTALARPGPFGGGVTEEYIQRMNGKKYEPIHPLVERHMLDTYGLPVYQEQTLAIVREIGRFDWKDTSTIRKVMSKRMGKEFFDTFWARFKKGALEQGISEQDAAATWSMINSAGAWAMNKAHTFSYAVISYWTAYLKAHHPLEFAAANLRSAKDEDSAIQLLREMVAEGIKYKPFDLALSEENWSAKDGVLVGGFLALKGFGAVKAKKFVAARNAGELTEKQKTDVAGALNAFDDIFPIQTRYGHLYADPQANGIGDDKVFKIGELDGTQNGSCVFIGELVYKNMRNANEEINVKKRGGKMETGPLEFIDLRIRDDTGIILARVNRFDYERMGKEINEQIPAGAHLMVRARFSPGFRFGFIQRWKLLEMPEKERTRGRARMKAYA